MTIHACMRAITHYSTSSHRSLLSAWLSGRAAVRTSLDFPVLRASTSNARANVHRRSVADSLRTFLSISIRSPGGTYSQSVRGWLLSSALGRRSSLCVDAGAPTPDKAHSAGYLQPNLAPGARWGGRWNERFIAKGALLFASSCSQHETVRCP